MEIKIENLQVQLAVAVKYTGVSMVGIVGLCGEGYGRIMSYLAQRGKQMAGSPYLAYMNANEDWSLFDVELGIPVAEEMPEQDGISMSKTCEGKAICAMYQGAYKDVGVAYEALMKHMIENGMESTGIYYDYYINDPACTPESELLTKVVFPIKNECECKPLNISPCGIDCGTCCMRKQCGDGCQQTCGKPFYIKDFGVERCPIYDCSHKKGYNNCGECAEVPCQIFFDWKDPSMSDEQHRAAVEKNVAFLKEMKKNEL